MTLKLSKVASTILIFIYRIDAERRAVPLRQPSLLLAAVSVQWE